jgi:hypothetical protein
MQSDSWAVQRYARSFAYWLALASASWLFLIRLCGWIYQCGCRNWWDGGAAQCNIHLAHAKHCPLCATPYVYDGLLLVIVIAQGRLVWRGGWLWAALAFPGITLFSTLVLGWYRGYW